MISIIIMGIKKRIPNTIDSIISNTLFSFFIVILLFCKHLYLLNFLLRFYHKINIFSSCLCGQKENSTYEKSSFLKCLIKIPIGNAVLPSPSGVTTFLRRFRGIFCPIRGTSCGWRRELRPRRESSVRSPPHSAVLPFRRRGSRSGGQSARRCKM